MSARKRYDVELRVMTDHYATVRVTANDEEHAEVKAKKRALDGKVKFKRKGYDWDTLTVTDIEDVQS